MLIKNGGLLLEKLIAFNNGRGNSIRSFSVSDLKNATNNYDQDKVTFPDGLYILYDEFLEDRHVIVKKYKDQMLHDSSSNKYDNINLDHSISDVVFSSQLIMHKNVLKLLGFCLGSSIPILVFEFAEKGSLDDYIYSKNSRHGFPLSWKIRLKIAVDVANVIAYLHTGFSRPIIHRGIKTEIILLDEDYGAKVSGFSFSISLPEGETYINDDIKGTWKYLAPEYARESKFNEKIDVYSFGIVLLVLLTGRDPYNPYPDDTEAQYCDLADVIKKHIENDRFEEIFDPIIVEEEPWPGKEQQLKAFLTLALHCAVEDPEERPEITNVGKQLKQMHQSLISNCVPQH